MSWKSKTGQFGSVELRALENAVPQDLARQLYTSAPLVVLRALAEILLNGDLAKLDALMADSDVSNNWRSYGSDPGVDGRDHEYARRLRERLGE